MPNESAKIILAATHGKLTKVRDCLLIEDSINSIQCQFEFRTSDWDNTSKTAVFVRGWATPSTPSDDMIVVVLDENNTCNVPFEVLDKGRLFSVGVFGSSDDYRIVSNWMYYKIKDGCFAEGSSSLDPTPGVYEQILTILNNKSNTDHKHDERYYTKDESKEKFLVKEDIPEEVLKVTFSTTDGRKYTADTTYDEIAAAINNGQFVYGCIGKTILPYSHTYVISNVPSYQFVYDYTEEGVLIGLLVNPDNTITYSSEKIVAPNPNPIVFTGAVSATYDGSKAITVDIPQAEINEEVKQELKDYVDEKIKIVNLNDTNIVNIWEYDTGIYIFRSPSYSVVFNVKEGEDDGTVKIGLIVMDASVMTTINHKSATNLEAWSCTIIGGSSPSMCRTVYTTHVLSTSMWEKGVYAFINKPLINGTNGQVLTYDETAGTGQVKWSDIPEDTTKLDKNLGSDNAGKVITVDDEGTLVATDLPEQIQADLEQYDSTAVDYVKNRTHYINNTYPDAAIDVQSPEANTIYLLQDFEAANANIDGLKTDIASTCVAKNDGEMKYYTGYSVRLQLTYSILGKDIVNSKWPSESDISLIDTVNYKILWNGNSFVTYYVILDLSTLTSEYSSQFTKLGIYGITTTTSVTDLQAYVAQCIRLDDKYIPSDLVTDRNLIDLNTTNKTVVGAINEVNIKANEQPIFVVIITDDGETYSANKTFTEIREACNNGKIVIATNADGDIYNLTYIDDRKIEFRSKEGDNARSHDYIYHIYKDGTIEQTDFIIGSYPTSKLPGGVIADPKTALDVIPAKIGGDGKLYVQSNEEQPDWNQIGSEAVDYIKNKPFYEVEAHNYGECTWTYQDTTLDNSEVTFTVQHGDDNIPLGGVNATFKIINETTTFTAEFVRFLDISSNGATAMLSSLAGGFKWYIYVHFNYSTGTATFSADNSLVTGIRAAHFICGNEYAFKQIDEKFIPNSIARTSDILEIEPIQTELIDIRTAADGTTYETAGEAVRAQVNELKAVDDEVKNDVEKLNVGAITVDDMANSWWCNPRAIYSDKRKMAYISGVTSEGLCGIGIFDRKLLKTDFVRLSYTYKDDHNAPAFLIEDDKPPIVAYTGHAQYNYVRVRVGDAPYDVKSLENKEDTEVAFVGENNGDKCTYASLIRITGTSKVVLFTRVGQAIYYRVSENWGTTWGTEKKFIYPYYYMTFKICTDGYAKIAVSKHPITHHSRGIYYFRLQLSTGNVIGRSGAYIGNILDDDFTAIELDNNDSVIKVDVTSWEEDTYGTRLLDVGNSAHILAVRLDYTNPSIGGTYGIYDPSSQDGWTWTPIVSTGLPVGYAQSAYIGGGCFAHNSIGDSVIYLCREDNGIWYTEEWRLDGNNWINKKTIEESAIKTGRPQIPWGDNGNVLGLINYRYYNDTNFTDYFGDEKVVEI